MLSKHGVKLKGEGHGIRRESCTGSMVPRKGSRAAWPSLHHAEPCCLVGEAKGQQCALCLRKEAEHCRSSSEESRAPGCRAGLPGRLTRWQGWRVRIGCPDGGTGGAHCLTKGGHPAGQQQSSQVFRVLL